MIRQTITMSQFRDLVNSHTHEQITKLINMINGDDNGLIDTSNITIGVLQGLLLEAGYSYHVEQLETSEYSYEVSIYTLLENAFDEDCKYIECKVKNYTSEPVDILLEAVLTLVIGD